MSSTWTSCFARPHAPRMNSCSCVFAALEFPSCCRSHPPKSARGPLVLGTSGSLKFAIAGQGSLLHPSQAKNYSVLPPRLAGSEIVELLDKANWSAGGRARFRRVIWWTLTNGILYRWEPDGEEGVSAELRCILLLGGEGGVL